MAGKFQAELKVDVSQAITGVEKVEKKIGGVVENVKTLRGLKATAKVDVDVNDSEVTELKKDVAAVDGKSVNLNVKVDDSQLDKTTAKASKVSGGLAGSLGGLVVGGAAIAGVALLGKELLHGALAGDELADSLEIAYAQAGVTDLQANVEATTKANLDLANALGQPVQRIDELSLAAAGLAGASGKANTDLVKLASAAETSTGGLVKGEALIKAFSRGMADPESAAAIDALSKKFPQLTNVLKGSGTAAEKTQAALIAMGPTFATLEQQAKGPDAVLQTLKNTLSRSFEEAGAQVFEAITPITKVLGEILPPLLQSLGPALGGIVASVAPLLASLATELGPVISKIAEALVPAIGSLVAGLLPVVNAIFPALLLVLTAVAPVFATLAETVGIVIAVLATGLAPIILLVAEVVSRVVTAIEPLIASLGDILPPIILALLEPIGDLLAALLPLIPIIVETLVPIIEILARVLGVLLVGAIKILTPIINTLTEIIKVIVGAVDKASQFFAGLFQTFANGTQSTSFLGQAFTKISEIIQKFINSLPDWAKKILGLNDAVAGTTKKTGEATAATKQLTEAEQKAAQAAIGNAAAGKKAATAKTGSVQTQLQLAQQELKLLISKRAVELDDLTRANRRLVLTGEIATQEKASQIEALAKQKITNQNLLDTQRLLKLTTSESGVVTTTIKLNADEIKNFDAKAALRDVKNQFDDAEFAVIKFDTDISKQKLGKQVADALAFANELAGAKFFDFDESTLKRFIDKGIDGVDGFSDFVAKRVAELDAQIKILGELAAQQNETERAKSLTDVTKLETAKLAILQKAATAEIEVRKGVAEKLEEENVLGTALAKTLASFEIVVDNDAANKALEETKELIAGVNKEFASGELTYQQAMEKLKDVSKEQSDFMEAVASAVAKSGEELATTLQKSAADGYKANQNVGDAATLIAASVGASFASMAVSGEDVWVAIAKSAFDGLQALVPIISAQILALALSTPQSVFTAGGAGFAEWAILTAVIQAAVSGARAAAGFKDGGPTGDNIGSNQVAGVVHGKEFVAPERMYAKHGDLLKHLYANRELSSFPEIQSLMKQNQIIPMRDLALNMGGGSQSITVNAMAGDALKPLQDELQGVRRQLVAMEALHKSSSDITVTADEGYHARRARRSAIKGARN